MVKTAVPSTSFVVGSTIVRTVVPAVVGAGTTIVIELDAVYDPVYISVAVSSYAVAFRAYDVGKMGPLEVRVRLAGQLLVSHSPVYWSRYQVQLAGLAVKVPAEVAPQ
jgi:hypothetical protein